MAVPSTNEGECLKSDNSSGQLDKGKGEIVDGMFVPCEMRERLSILKRFTRRWYPSEKS